MDASAGNGGRRPPGRLEAALRRGDFAMTAETTPPDSADRAGVLAPLEPLRGLVDAVNVTDCAGARAHMSALAGAALLAGAGIEPVMQLTARDRNRLALQGDLLGAAALGIANVLCLRGDDPKSGDHPEAKPVYDLDTCTMVRAAHTLRGGAYLSGRPVDPAPRLFIGAADAPCEPAGDWTPAELSAKLDAGADFVQTQYCFDMAMLRRYMARLCDSGIPERVFILVGIGPLASERSARWMNDNLHGVHVPEALIRRLAGAPDQRAEGCRTCVELLHELREIEGVAGVHFMGSRQEESIARVNADAGVGAGRRAAR